MRPGFHARSKGDKSSSVRAIQLVRARDLRSTGYRCQANRVAGAEKEGSCRLLLAGAGGVVLQRLDALGEGAAALGGSAAIGRGAAGRARRFG